jgi:MoxR-like ATPase
MTEASTPKQLSKSELHGFVKKIREDLNNEVLGQETLVDEILSCLMASGHILITGAPGLAKTTIVKALSRHLGLTFGRVQFTPDLLPTDITGSDILNINSDTGQKAFSFQKGPIFANLILADEINRASPRTQSALLEAMQEKMITFGGQTYALPQPFTVFATENPFESEGVFPLPEAQLDRFLLNSVITYPEAYKEIEVLQRHAEGKLSAPIKKKEARGLSREHLEQMSKACMEIRVEKELISLIHAILEKTRQATKKGGSLLYGAGTRAGMSLISVGKSLAFIEGLESVRWYHIEKILKPCLRHRIKLTSTAYYDGITEDSLVDTVTEEVKNEYKKLIEGLS